MSLWWIGIPWIVCGAFVLLCVVGSRHLDGHD